MKYALKVMTRCLVVEFYKQNSAFFGLLFLVFFGFIKGQEHVVLGTFLVTNPGSLFFLLILWVAYCIKIILFILPTLNQSKNQFMEVFCIFPLRTKIIVAAIVSSSLLLLAIGYSLFLLLLAVQQAYFVSFGLILLEIITLVISLAFVIFRKLNGLRHEVSFVQVRFLYRIAKPSFLFFIEHLIRNDLVLLFLTKVYSGLMIIGTTALYETDQFDLRLLSTGVLLAAVGNVAIMHKYIWFYHQKLKFINNLPERICKSTMRHFLTFLMLMIPEFVIILRHFPLSPNLPDVSGTLLFAFSITSLIYSMLLIRQIELSDFIVKLFWLIVFCTFLILFSVHPFILGIVFILVSLIMLYLRQYKFEYIELNK